MLFSKVIEKRFPTPQEIVDKVILLAFSYGSSSKMADAQAKFLKNNAKLIPKPYKEIHKHPASMPSELLKKSPTKKVLT